MPCYCYESIDGNERIFVIQSMNEPHVYFRDGIKWNRVFFSNFASVDSRWDPMSSQDFVNKTGKKRGTLGDLYQQSAELSEKREKIMGKDFKKEKHLDNYERLRKGKQHEVRRKEKLKNSLAKKGVILED